MTKPMRLARLGLAGLQMEGECKIRHAQYRTQNGYRYCPWCGNQLIVRITCDHCGRHFLSEQSYHIHLHELALYKANRCPNEGQGKSHHVIHYMKNRDKFFCESCRLEYKPKPVSSGKSKQEEKK
jgi:hypothetical protein